MVNNDTLNMFTVRISKLIDDFFRIRNNNISIKELEDSECKDSPIRNCLFRLKKFVANNSDIVKSNADKFDAILTSFEMSLQNNDYISDGTLEQLMITSESANEVMETAIADINTIKKTIDVEKLEKEIELKLRILDPLNEDLKDTLNAWNRVKEQYIKENETHKNQWNLLKVWYEKNDNLVARYDATITDLQKTADKKISAAIEGLQQKAETIMTGIENQEKTAKDIIGAMSQSAIENDFGKVAEIERIAGIKYRKVAMDCLVGFLLVGVAFIFFNNTWNKTTSADKSQPANTSAAQSSIPELALRSLAVLGFLVPFWYCASESNKHMRISHRNKRMQMELAAMRPYLERLNDAELSKKVMSEIAPKFFAGHDKDYDDGKTPNLKKLLNSDLLKILLAILEATTGKKSIDLGNSTDAKN